MNFRIFLGLLFLLPLLALCQHNKTLSDTRDSLLLAVGPRKTLVHYETLLKKDPTNAKYKILVAVLHAECGDTAAAFKDFEALQGTGINSAFFHLEYAKVLFKNKAFEKAITSLSEGLVVNPQAAILYVARAEMANAIGQRAGLLSDFNKAVALEPEEPEWYIRRGLFNSQNGYYALAENDLQMALLLNPSSANTYFLLAQLFFESNQLILAKNAMDTALLLSPNNAPFISSSGRILEQLGDYDGAFFAFDKARSLDSTLLSPIYFEALLHYKLEDMDAFCNSLREVTVGRDKGYPLDKEIWQEITDYQADICDSNKVSYYYHRGIAAYNKGDFVSAILSYERGFLLEPNHPFLLIFMANAFLKLQAYKDANYYFQLFFDEKGRIPEKFTDINFVLKKSAAEQQIFVNRTIAEAYFLSSLAKSGLDDYKGAIIQLDSAIVYSRNNRQFILGDAYSYRGLLNAIIGKPEAALSDFSKSIAVLPNQTNAHIWKTTLEVNQINGVSKPVDMKTFLFANKNPYFGWEVKKNKQVKQVRPFIEVHIERLEELNRDQKDPMLYYLIGSLKLVIRNANGCLDIERANALGFPVSDVFCK